MTYKEFVDLVAESLPARFPKEFDEIEISTTQVDKMQDESYYGISAKIKDSNLGLMNNLEGYYDEYCEGKKFNDVLQEIAEDLSKHIEERPKINTDVLLDYNIMKNVLMIQAVPVEGNREKLKNVPHRIVGDIAAVYRLVIDQSHGTVASILITNNLLNEFGITENDLHNDAVYYSSRNFPASITSMKKIMADNMELPVEAIPGPDNLFVATCNHGEDGAGCIFYPEFMVSIAKEFNGGFYVLPSSVHEIIVLPESVGMPVKEMNYMVRTINQNEVQRKDRLSNNAYHYDAELGQLELATEFEKRTRNEHTKSHGYRDIERYS